MLSISKISKHFGPKTLFKDLSFQLNAGDRVGLVGANGAGKSTLFSIILGQTEADSGQIELERGLTIGFLPQESAPTDAATVLELACSINPTFKRIYQQLREHPAANSEVRLQAQARFAELDGYALEAKAQQILAALSFKPDAIRQAANRLSGGWIMRAHLARLLLMEPDLLMLDEPTNHLDLETLDWFQSQLKRFAGSLITISHDRAFLNAVCSSIIEINHNRLNRYQGGYDQYQIQKAERDAQYRAAYNNQQKEIAHLEDFIRRFQAKASKASQAQARIKQLEKMERLSPPESEDSSIAFSFPQPLKSGQKVVKLDAIQQAYGNQPIYQGLNLEIQRGERVVLVGPNGAGKSTLLKIIAERVPIQSGSCQLGHQVQLGYFSQQRSEELNLNNTVLEEVSQRHVVGLSEVAIRSLLGAFLFKGDDVHKCVKVLSGGEKSRLALVKLLLDPPNLLLLDEPTTHLDIASIDALVQALKSYTGTLIFVSHDVYFIRSLAERTIQINAGKLTHYAGNYDYYLQKSGVSNDRKGLVAGQKMEAVKSEKSAAPPKESAKDRRRRLAQDRAQERKKRSQMEKLIQGLEKNIIDLEQEQAQLTQSLAADDHAAKANLAIQLARISKRLAEKNYEWECAAEKLESICQEA
jgi:ATP-binding cassette subfamily F protein 3